MKQVCCGNIFIIFSYIFKEHLKNDFFYPLYNFKFLKKPMIFLSKLSGIDKVNNVEGKR